MGSSISSIWDTQGPHLDMLRHDAARKTTEVSVIALILDSNNPTKNC